MADISILFNCRTGDGTTAETFRHYSDEGNEESICVSLKRDNEYPITIYLDKSTAIKLAKTIRTEINKMED